MQSEFHRSISRLTTWDQLHAFHRTRPTFSTPKTNQIFRINFRILVFCFTFSIKSQSKKKKSHRRENEILFFPVKNSFLSFLVSIRCIFSVSSKNGTVMAQTTFLFSFAQFDISRLSSSIHKKNRKSITSFE